MGLYDNQSNRIPYRYFYPTVATIKGHKRTADIRLRIFKFLMLPFTVFPIPHTPTNVINSIGLYTPFYDPRRANRHTRLSSLRRFNKQPERSG